MSVRSLIINPGSTSTKIGVFDDEQQVFDKTLRHSTEEIAQYDRIVDQMSFRRDIILEALKENHIDIATLNVVVGRGGMLRPVEGGTYAVTDALAEDLRIGVQGEHASNLGGLLAREIGDSIGVPSYIVDPTVVDELEPVARISGIPEIERVSVFHALNAKAMARRYAGETGRKYSEINVIVVHMGGGVSVSAHHHGRVVDVFNALDGDGAFSPERAGGLPAGALVKLCFESGLSEKEVRRRIVGDGGFNAYLGTNDARDVDKMCENGDEKAILVRDAFIYQICKNIGAMAVVLGGAVDRIILTGGIAHDKYVTSQIEKKVSFLAPVTIYAGEDELLALAQGALRVMNGEEQAKVY